MLKVITGIGSRNTPENILVEACKIGCWCKANNVYVRSGHADGADFAFEKGAQDHCIAYLPWKGFQNHNKSSAKMIVPEFTKELMDIVYRYHPAPGNLDEYGLKLQARNGCQILGQKLNSPTQLVICWTENYLKPSGGTSQAIRIAEAYGIPVWNMQNPAYDCADKIIPMLVELHSKKG